MTPEQAMRYIERQNEHQLNSDLRIRGQREEIKRLKAEVDSLRHEITHAYNLRQQTEQWADKDSAFWKIYSLERQNRLLMGRLKGARRYLKGEPSHRQLLGELTASKVPND